MKHHIYKNYLQYQEIKKLEERREKAIEEGNIILTNELLREIQKKEAECDDIIEGMLVALEDAGDL